MKKLMILAFAATMAIGASSCKKNKDCVCTVAGIPVTTPDVTKAQCDDLDAAAEIAGGNCEFK